MRSGLWNSLFRVTLAVFLLASFSSSRGQTPQGAEPGTGIEGVINVGPIHGGPTRVGVADSKPLANVVFVVQNDKEAEVASFTTDAQGQFHISLAPGHYRVIRKDAQPRIGRSGPFEVDVVAGQMTRVAWSCDSGMR
jgi:hypothetical protein